VANLSSVSRRALPFVLVLAAAVVDVVGLRSAATYLLVAAVPAAAAAALTVFGELVQRPGRSPGIALARTEAVLSAFALVSVVVAGAARAAAVDGAAVPPLAVSALVACLTSFALQACITLLAPAPLDAPQERTDALPADPARAA
jgi:hypothetical protein